MFDEITAALNGMKVDRMKILQLIAIASLMTGADASGAGPFSPAPSGDELVRPTLMLEESAAAPGATIHLGVVFQIEPGWHIYWRNSGDTGYAPAITLDLPPGVTALETQWPAPMRYEHSGLVDFIYEREVTLIIPLVIDHEFAAEELPIFAEVDWLVCKEECLPGAQALSLTIDVRHEAEDVPLNAVAAPYFAAARERAPRSSGDAVRDGVDVQFVDRRLIISAPGAEALTFFPLAPRQAPPVKLARDTFVESDELVAEYDARVDRAQEISGVLRVRRNGADVNYFIKTPGPGFVNSGR